MPAGFVSPEELGREADVVQEISRHDSFFIALVQRGGDSEGALQVCQIGVGEWIEVPLAMMASAKIVGTASAEGRRYQVALIKLKEPADPYAKVAYKLLTQLGTISRRATTKGDCGCEGDAPEERATRTGYAASRISQRDGLIGGLGRFGIGGNCHFEFRCGPCTRCIPWTDVCWSSTCCDLVAVDCTIEV